MKLDPVETLTFAARIGARCVPLSAVIQVFVFLTSENGVSWEYAAAPSDSSPLS
jgi:hypothetical protein